MVDLETVRMELAIARRARREAQMAGLDLERVIERMQAGHSLQQIELEDMDPRDPVAETFVAIEAFRQAA